MVYFKYFLLLIILGNTDSFLIVAYGSAALGSLFSALMYGGLLIYYFLNKKHHPAWLFLIFGLLYFAISGAVAVPYETFYKREFMKFMIMIICGSELARNTTLNELLFFLSLGASSILIHSAFFESKIGRYSGFYIDPNSASFVCLMAICLTYALKRESIRLLLYFFLTLCGALTFSRTFFLLWFVMSAIAVLQHKKNLKTIGLGAAALLLLISLSSILDLNTQRLNMIEGFFGENVENASSFEEDSRTETWALYYDDIYDAPFFGNGWLSFSGQTGVRVGVHNSYMRIIGEAGIFTLLVYLSFYAFLFFKSLKIFWEKVHYFILTLSIMGLLLTIHNFDGNEYITILSLWLFFQLTVKEYNSEEKEDGEIDSFTLKEPT
jgi:hypothetical protein